MNLPIAAPPQSPGSASPEEADHSARVMYTYMLGVYLAINAIRDAFLLIEGPDCVHMKTQYVQGNHDWFSTLTSVSGFHRVGNTALHPAQMAASREARLREALQAMAAHPSSTGVVLTSMPMAFITGADYERLCSEVAQATGKTLIHVPGKSLSGDWLDGYEETLLALARQLPLPEAGDRKRDATKVAIVGYLYDRGEDDHRANVRDLRALLSAIGLDTVSIWLEGQSFSQLADVAEAGTILSFPYGRRAARALARRTSARLIECPLPFGLTATETWMRQLAAEFGKERELEAYASREMTSLVPRLEWVIPFVFQNRRFGYVGDPHLARGMQEIAEVLGAKLTFAVITNNAVHAGSLQKDWAGKVPVMVHPRANAFHNFIGDVMRQGKIDLLVTNNAGVGAVDAAATVEFGFPSMYTHHLYDAPFLGLRGFLSFVDRLANAIRWEEVQVASRARRRTRLHGPTR